MILGVPWDHGRIRGQQPRPTAEEKARTDAAADEEKSAYVAAKQEPDIYRRALLLSEFAQKYPGSSLLQPEDREILKRLEKEYDAYYPITRETDADNRAAMLIDFLQSHPKSILWREIEPEYRKALEETAKSKNYELLEALAENWLAAYPDRDRKEIYRYLAEATCGLDRHPRCARALEEIYALEPLPATVKDIYASYQKTDNLAKQIEWAQKLYQIEPLPALARAIYGYYRKTADSAKEMEWAEKLVRMPEFDEDYALRYSIVLKYHKDKDLTKAAEYAKLTLQSLDRAGRLDDGTQEESRQIRRACYHVIASERLEKGDCAEAVGAFRKAIRVEKYAEAYYQIALCLDKQKKIDEACIYYAAAELMGGDFAPKAKARLETLYKALHNNTLIGINKVYTKAKELLAE